MTWQTFKGKGTKYSAPAASISPAGVIVLNSSAVRAIDKDVTFVEFLFDAENKKIGLRLLKTVSAFSYPVRRYGTECRITANSFLREYQLMPEKTQHFEILYNKEEQILEMAITSDVAAKLETRLRQAIVEQAFALSGRDIDHEWSQQGVCAICGDSETATLEDGYCQTKLRQLLLTMAEKVVEMMKVKDELVKGVGR